MLVNATAESPKKHLEAHDITVVEMSGLIRLGLAAWYHGRDVSTLKTR